MFTKDDIKFKIVCYKDDTQSQSLDEFFITKYMCRDMGSDMIRHFDKDIFLPYSIRTIKSFINRYIEHSSVYCSCDNYQIFTELAEYFGINETLKEKMKVDYEEAIRDKEKYF